MSNMVKIELEPLGRTLKVARGTPLQDILFALGVEFPCGGRGRCRGCKVRVIEGELPAKAEDAAVLSESELAGGWRLACQASAQGDLKIDLAQWEASILTDHSSVVAFAPRDELGAVVDLGTTTLVAQLLDLRTGQVLGVRMALNAQAKHGADVMSRIECAMGNGGLERLSVIIRSQIGPMVKELLDTCDGSGRPLQEVMVVGNTVMHHLFCGVDVAPLSQSPFEPVDDGLRVFRARELGWSLPTDPEVHFLPCLGGFVGSDILAGILATRIHESEEVCALVDLGTNGEIVVGNRERMVCASTAAGPAFEGARISMGMRAATGAISAVKLNDGGFHCHVLGNTKPRGICGSGLVDAVACALDSGRIKPSGRLVHGETLLLAQPVQLTQGDIRELQLAKGAIAAGIRILAGARGVTLDEIAKVNLAGAFGNYISRASARRIGLIEFPLEKVEPAGNTALLGAKLALFTPPSERDSYQGVLSRQTHVCLHEDPLFQDVYAEQMLLP